MGKISNIQKEKELIGCMLLSRDAINQVIDFNFMANECVNKFNKEVIEIILNKARIDFEYIPTINSILEELNLSEKEYSEAQIKLNRYKKMIQREIINEYQIKELTNSNLFIVRDQSIKRRAIHAIKNGLDRIDLSAREFISNLNKDLTSIEIDDGEVTEVDIFTGFKEIKEEMEYMLENDIEFGYKSFLRDVDEMFGDCISNGSLTYIVGRPSNYKTGVALNLAYNMAEKGIPVAIFSHEMSPKNCYRRILARIADIEMSKIKKPKTLTSDEWQRLSKAIEIVENIPLFIIDGSKLHIGQIDSVIAYLKSKYGVKVVYFDYFQLIRKRDGSIPTDERDFAEISEELRMFPKKYELAVISLSQANRNCEMRDDKRPTLKDIRSSGKSEQDAENIFYVYRDEFYFHSKSEMPNHLEIGALKVREGELKRVLLHFNGSKARLSNCDPLIVADKGPEYIGGGVFNV